MRSSGLTVVALTIAAWLANTPGAIPAAAPPRLGRPDPDPLPPGALVRLGSRRWVMGAGGHALAFSPDGKLLASTDHQDRVFLWDRATGRVLHTLCGVGTVRQIAFSSEGCLLATSGEGDRIVGLWRLPAASEVLPAPEVDLAGSRIAFSPDGKLLALTRRGEGDLVLWDVAARRMWRRFPGIAVHRCEALAFTPDGKQLLWTGGKGALDALDLGSAVVTPRGRLPYATARSWFRGAFGRGCKTLLGHLDGGPIRCWDCATGREMFRLPATAGAACWTLSPDGRSLALAGRAQDGYSVHLWDVRSRKEVRSWRCGSEELSCLAFSPDGTVLAAQLDDGTIRLWEAATGRDLNPDRGQGALLAMAFSPSGNWVATSARKATVVRLWDARTGRELRRLAVAGHGLVPLAFCPAGEVLACKVDDRGIRLWQVKTGQQLGALEVGDSIRSATLAPGGRVVLVLARQTALLWNPGTRKVVRWFPGTTQPASAPGSPAAAVETADGRLVAAGDRQGRLVLRETCSGGVLRVFPGHGGRAIALHFSADGKRLASAGSEGTVLVWDVWAEQHTDARSLPATRTGRDALWDDLAAQASRAYPVLCLLQCCPRQAVPFLRRRVPAVDASAKRLAGLIAELASDEYATRQAATRQLERLGDVARPTLRKAVTAGLDLEQRRRIERLLKGLSAAGLAPPVIRDLRVIAVLERIGTADALKVLQGLAKGTAGARQTQEAKAACLRLEVAHVRP
jgi:WD40 repeat protein